MLTGPWVPWPRRDGSVRARLFLIVDDHSRLLVDGRFFARENARACQELLRRAITRRGLPQVFPEPREPAGVRVSLTKGGAHPGHFEVASHRVMA